MIYATDTTLAKLIPEAALQPYEMEQLAADAAAVYQFLDTSRLIGEHELRQWAEHNDLPNERLNLALRALTKLGRIAALPDQLAPPPAAPAKPRRHRKT